MLLDDLISKLGNESASITEILLQTKILLHGIGEKQIIDWVNHELNGYPDEAELPEYRTVHAMVRASLASIAWTVQSHPIPLGHLKSAERKTLENRELRQSLAVLSDLIRRAADGKSGGHLEFPLAMELNGLLAKGLGEGVHIQKAWCEMGVSELANVPAQIRSRLLDFLLELRTTSGHPATEANLKTQAESFDAAKLFQHSVFGDNATIIVGSGNSQTIQTLNVAGDFNSLSESLTRAGLQFDDIDALRKAIEADKNEHGGASFEGHTGHWYTGLLQRAAKGGLKIGTEVAATAVSKALIAYMGG